MGTTYRVLAWLIVAAVAVQAAAIAFAFFGLGAWIRGGGVLDKAAMESETTAFYGDAGFAWHGITGEMVIPVLVLVLLIVSFFAKMRRGTVFAGVLVLLVALQVLLGLLSFESPGLGMLHGVNALLIAAVAIFAGLAPARQVEAVPEQPAAAAVA